MAAPREDEVRVKYAVGLDLHPSKHIPRSKVAMSWEGSHEGLA